MSRIITLLAFLTFSVTVNAQIQMTQIEFDKTAHNFGTIEEIDGDVSHTFTFTNTGTNTLVINTILNGCGCTVSQWTKNPIPPGQSRKITVTFNPSGYCGAFEKLVEVVCNIEGGRKRLSISGVVNPRPKTIADDFPVILEQGLRLSNMAVYMGYIPKGREITATIKAVNNSESTLQLDVDESLLRPFVAVNLDKHILVPKEQCEITITFDATKIEIWGVVESYFKLVINGIKSEQVFGIKGIIIENNEEMTKEQLRDAPYSDYSSYFYHFSDNKVGSKLDHEFSLTNSGVNDLIVRYLDYNHDNLIVTSDITVIKAGQTAIIKVEMLRTETPSRISETLRVITNDPKNPVQTLQVMATIK